MSSLMIVYAICKRPVVESDWCDLSVLSRVFPSAPRQFLSRISFHRSRLELSFLYKSCFVYDDRRRKAYFTFYSRVQPAAVLLVLDQIPQYNVKHLFE